MARVLGVATRTEVGGSGMVVADDVGEGAAGAKSASTAEACGVVAGDSNEVLGVCGAARGRDAAHPAAPIVTRRTATRDA
jgi:hypothetical protein